MGYDAKFIRKLTNFMETKQCDYIITRMGDDDTTELFGITFGGSVFTYDSLACFPLGVTPNGMLICIEADHPRYSIQLLKDTEVDCATLDTCEDIDIPTQGLDLLNALHPIVIRKPKADKVRGARRTTPAYVPPTPSTVPQAGKPAPKPFRGTPAPAAYSNVTPKKSMSKKTLPLPVLPGVGSYWVAKDLDYEFYVMVYSASNISSTFPTTGLPSRVNFLDAKGYTHSLAAEKFYNKFEAAAHFQLEPHVKLEYCGIVHNGVLANGFMTGEIEALVKKQEGVVPYIQHVTEDGARTYTGESAVTEFITKNFYKLTGTKA